MAWNERAISDLLVAPWKIAVLTTAVRLKVFTFMANNLMTAEEISSHCRSVAHFLKPLLNACVSMGLIDVRGDKYLNSHFSRIYLVEGEPYFIGDFIQLLNNEAHQWDKLYDIIKNGEKSTMMDESEEEHRIFIRGMNNLGMIGEADALLNSVDLSKCRSMIDAGGGSGLYSIALCRKYPKLRSTILDKKETLVITNEMISNHEESERIELRESDITKDAYGEKIDVVLLSDVIYEEYEAESILKNAWDCLISKGKLIVRGYYSDPVNSKPLFGALFVLNQLVSDPGRNIMDIESFQDKIVDVGFIITKCSPLTERSFIVIAKKNTD